MANHKPGKEMQKMAGGWTSANNVPRGMLKLIGWEEYIKTAKEPYPAHLVPRPESPEATSKGDE